MPPYRRSAVAALMTHERARCRRAGRPRPPPSRPPARPFGAPPRSRPGARRVPRRVDRSRGRAGRRRPISCGPTSRGGSRPTSSATRLPRPRAARTTDRLVGRLLDDVDPARDAVIVVGPASPERAPVAHAGVGARAGFAPGSAALDDDATRRLREHGRRRARRSCTSTGSTGPESMEGRQMDHRRHGRLAGVRVSSLVDANEDGLFRDSQVGAVDDDRPRDRLRAGASGRAGRLAPHAGRAQWARRGAWPLTFLALALIGFLDATYLAGPVPLRPSRRRGAVLVVRRGRRGGAHRRVPRGRPSEARARAASSRSGASSCCTCVDLVTGAHLEWNTVFGYSPTIGIRFVGEGNMTFAQLVGGGGAVRRVVRVAGPARVPACGWRVGVLAVTVVVMGVPVWGNDFGAVLSALPGLRDRSRGCCSATRSAPAPWPRSPRSWSPRWSRSACSTSCARPTSARTSGKFFQKVGTDFDGATLVIRRKAAANLSVFGHSVLLGAIIATALLVAYLWYVAPAVVAAAVARDHAPPRRRCSRSSSSRCSASR